MKLIRLYAENFKGLRSFEAKFDGENAVITGENGTGKTTVYDIFLWICFGKDSAGRKSFEICPLNKLNEPVKGLVISGGAEIENEGTTHTLLKQQHEIVVKGQLRGYETRCFIDEVPKKVSEYEQYIGELIAEDTFKLLTDLHFFCEKLHWTKRRETLLAIAGEIGTPKGFDELAASLNGRTIEEYKAVLAAQKKRLEQERDEINPRIDETQRGLSAYAGGSSTKQLETRRAELRQQLDAIDKQRQQLFDQERVRQEKIADLNDLKAQKAVRESQLANDTTGTQNLLDEKAKLDAGLNIRRLAVSNIEPDIAAVEAKIRGKEAERDAQQRILSQVRDEYTQLQSQADPATCSLCGQTLPPARLTEMAKKREAMAATIAARGNTAKKVVGEANITLESLQGDLRQLQGKLAVAKASLLRYETERAEKSRKLDTAIAGHVKPKPENDHAWLGICEQIAKAEAVIGPSVNEQMKALEASRKVAFEDLTSINQTLAQADQIAKATARIVELQVQEKKLSQQIAETDRQLADIDDYKADESKLIEAAVNGKFKHVTFKLFNRLLNGSIEDTCEAMLNGVPYADMSGGQKIMVGIDIINTLSAHYQLSVPLFLDNAERFTLPIEATSQVIQLFAKKGVKKLEVKVQKSERAVA